MMGDMQDALTISQLGKQVGVPAKTIRFYESIGLIAKPERAENGYRMYKAGAAEELAVIKHARGLGLPIEKIKTLMQGCIGSPCNHSKQYIEGEIDDYVGIVEEKILQLTRLKKRLQYLRKNIRFDDRACNDKKSYCCDILKQLEQLPEGGE